MAISVRLNADVKTISLTDTQLNVVYNILLIYMLYGTNDGKVLVC